MGWLLVADAFLGLHYTFLVFLLLGGFLGRRRWVLITHVATVVWGIGILTIGQPCPLTAGERWARRQAGEHPSTRGFIADHVTGHLYPTGAVHVVQAAAAAVIVLSWALLVLRVPPDGTDPSSRA